MVSRGREPAVVVPLLIPTGKLLFWFDPFGQLMQGGEKVGRAVLVKRIKGIGLVKSEAEHHQALFRQVESLLNSAKIGLNIFIYLYLPVYL